MRGRLRQFSVIWGAITVILVGLVLSVKPAQAADGTLPAQLTLEGNYCVAHGGIGLVEGPNSFTVTVTGTPVHAYLYWSSRYRSAVTGDAAVSIALNGGTSFPVTATATESAYAGFANAYYYTNHSANLAAQLPSDSTFTVTVSDLTTPEAHGAGLVVISEGDTCPTSRIQLNFGLDGFYWDFTPPAGADTEVTCVDFPAAGADRTMALQMFVGGVEHDRQRGDRIWFATGSGAKPGNIVSASDFSNVLAGPTPLNPTDPDPLNGGNGEWDNYVNTITLAAGTTYACFQIESIDGTARPGGTSGVWLELLTQIYFTPGLEVRKLTNGNDAQQPNDADVPQIAPGAPVTWTYLVTNTGQTVFPRAQVTVVDSVEGAITNLVGGDDGDNLFEPGETWIYQLVGVARTLASATDSFIVNGCGNSATGGVSRNTYANSVTATAGTLTASDTSHYCNALLPGLAVRKLTNGNDAQQPNDADVPVIAPGAAVTWTYLVTNTGQTTFARDQVTVVDSVEGAVTNLVGGDDGDNLFAPGETWIYQLVGVARTLASATDSFIVNGCGNGATGGVSRNTYANSVTATAGNLTAGDISHYCNPLLTATVGDRVWGDIDPNGSTPADIAAGNGIQENDQREQGISGILVELYTADNLLVDSTFTDANGEYRFTDLPPGDYYLVFVNELGEGVWTNANQGGNPAVDSDAATDVPGREARRTEIFTLSEGEVDLTWDAGLINLSGAGSAAVGNFVWNDLNQNGIQESGEAGIPNVGVRLFTSSGTLVAETTTNDVGIYNFGGVDPGDYFIEFILPNNFILSPQGAGDNEELDSDIDPTTRRTVIFSVPAFRTDLRWDAGLYQPTNLGDEQEPLRTRYFLPLISQ